MTATQMGMEPTRSAAKLDSARCSAHITNPLPPVHNSSPDSARRPALVWSGGFGCWSDVPRRVGPSRPRAPHGPHGERRETAVLAHGDTDRQVGIAPDEIKDDQVKVSGLSSKAGRIVGLAGYRGRRVQTGFRLRLLIT
jgi:hypothetical protein